MRVLRLCFGQEQLHFVLLSFPPVPPPPPTPPSFRGLFDFLPFFFSPSLSPSLSPSHSHVCPFFSAVNTKEVRSFFYIKKKKSHLHWKQYMIASLFSKYTKKLSIYLLFIKINWFYNLRFFISEYLTVWLIFVIHCFCSVGFPMSTMGDPYSKILRGYIFTHLLKYGLSFLEINSTHYLLLLRIQAYLILIWKGNRVLSLEADVSLLNYWKTK